MFVISRRISLGSGMFYQQTWDGKQWQGNSYEGGTWKEYSSLDEVEKDVREHSLTNYNLIVW